MLLPKVVVTAYLALQSQKNPTENHGSLEQIQSPLVQSRPHNEVSEVGDYVIEINGQPVATEHIDVKIPHGQNTHRTSSAPHALGGRTYVTFDDWKTGSVEGQSHDGVKLEGGNIYDISDFPKLRNDYKVSKIWGIPTDVPYKKLTFLIDHQINHFVYNIGYIVNGTLTAADFDVWYRSGTRDRPFLQQDTTWLNNPWKETVIEKVTAVEIVLSGFYSRSGILAFYDWGYDN